MNRIEKLIEEMCPEGVPTEQIGNLFVYEQPTKYLVLDTNYVSAGTPVLTAGQTFLLGHTDETEGIYPADKEHPIILFDDFTTSFKWVDFPFKVKSSAAKIIKPFHSDRDTLRFLFHWMGAICYEPGEHSRQWISKYSKILMPSPPLEIQKEIVNILDKFTQLEAELEAELEAREKQYEEVRRRLLDFESDTSNHPLGEMIREMCPDGIEASSLGANCDFVRGSTLDKKDLRESGLPVVHYGQIHTKYGYKSSESISFVEPQKAAKMRKANPGDLVLVTTSEDVEAVAKPMVWLGVEDLNVGGESYIIRSEIDSLFLAHFFMSPQFKKASSRYISGTKVKRISSSNLSKIEIPVPPLEIQKEIVRILDNLDSLVNSVNEGIPAEIAARRKQYEYYRDKLLTFKELDAA